MIKRVLILLGFLLAFVIIFPMGVEKFEIMPPIPSRKIRVIVLFFLPLVAAAVCFLLELGFKQSLAVSQAVSQAALLASFLVALSFALETESRFYLEFPDFGIGGELKSFRFKVDSQRCAFLAGATLLAGVCSIGGFINQPYSHPLTQTVIFFAVQVVLSSSFIQTFVVWCGLSISSQLLSFFCSGGIKMEVWWGMRSRNGCYPMLFLCLFVYSVYRSSDYDFVMSLTALSVSSHLTGLGGGPGLRLTNVMLGLVLFAALGPALEALYHAFSGKPRVYLVEIVVMGAVGCLLLQSWYWSVLLKHSSILGSTYKLLIALFFGS